MIILQRKIAHCRFIGFNYFLRSKCVLIVNGKKNNKNPAKLVILNYRSSLHLKLHVVIFIWQRRRPAIFIHCFIFNIVYARHFFIFSYYIICVAKLLRILTYMIYFYIKFRKKFSIFVFIYNVWMSTQRFLYLIGI